MEKIPASSQQDKWIAVGIWGVLFFLLIITTGSIALGLNIAVAIQTSFRYFYQPPVFMIVSIAVALLVLIYLIIRAWTVFFRFSIQLFISLGRVSGAPNVRSIFYDFLTFPKVKGEELEEGASINPEMATGSIVSRIIRLIALFYIVSIVEVLLIVLSSMFMFSD